MTLRLQQMEWFELLSPIQRDICLDEGLGTQQKYGIGVHWRVARALAPGAMRTAIKALGPLLELLARPFMQGLGLAPAPAVQFESMALDDDDALSSQVQELMKSPWDFKGGFVHVTLLTLRNGEQHLVVASHHAFFDGDSIVTFSQALLAVLEDPAQASFLLSRQAASDRALGALHASFDAEGTLAFWQKHCDGLAAPVIHPQGIDPQASIELVDIPVPDLGRIEAYCKVLKISLPFYFKCLFGWVSSRHYGLDQGIALHEVRNLRTGATQGAFGSLSGFVPFILRPQLQSSFSGLISTAREFQAHRKRFTHLSQFAVKQHRLLPGGLRFIFNYHDYSQRIVDHDKLQLVSAFTSEDPGAIQFYLYKNSSNELRAKCSHPAGPAAASRFLAGLQHVSQQLLGGVDLLLNLELVPPDELALLESWNATHSPFECQVTLHQLFERRAALVPDAVAVVHGDHSLSYRQLNEQANRLAHMLRHHGLGPNDIVGLYLERSLDMMVGILAVLKAGGAYLPLEGDHPDARLAFMIDDSRLKLLMTQSALSDRLATILEDRAIPCLQLDTQLSGSGSADANSANLDPSTIGLSSGNPAYVIYTSGSTGTPKGVMLAHRGIVNRLNWMQSAFRLGKDDTVLQKTPFGFDVSVWELLWPNQVGARLVFADHSGHKDPAYLARLIEAQRVTIVHFVPSMLRLFIDSPEVERARGLKHIVCSGEVLQPQTLADTIARLPRTRVWNLYGPTEASIDATWWSGEAGERYDQVPIGRPIDNMQCHVLDQDLKRLPIGSVGELCLGGAGIALGYLGQPELTAQKFVENTYGAPGARLYRTGDLARYRDDGTLDYLGRLDHQVKIRGLRVELGEIEHQIAQQFEVRETAVLVVAQGGEQAIWACLVLHDGQTLTTSQLQQRLRRTLPEHMVPTQVRWLAALPLLSNGKVDRRQLAELSPPSVEQARYEAPQGEAENLLAEIYGNLLGHPRVSRHDDFFELGGHSLLAIRLASELRARGGQELGFRDVFEAPRVHDLAKRLQYPGTGGLPPVLPLPRAQDAETRLHASFSQQRLWMLDKIDGSSAHYNVPIVLRVRGPLQPGLVRRCLQQLVMRHEPLRTVYEELDGTVMQVIRPHASMPLHEFDLCGLEKHTQEKAISEHVRREATKPFDLANDTMLRAACLHTGVQQGLLLVTLHHIATDGWSMDVLVDEFTRIYAALQAGQIPNLPPLVVQYADYAQWQRQNASHPRYQKQLRWWQQHLQQLPPVHSLPLSHERTARQTFAGTRHQFCLDALTCAKLKALCQANQATLFMALHAAFCIVLARYGGSRDIVVGIPVANRPQSSLAGLIGFFVNSLVLRLCVDTSLSFKAHLDRAKAVNLDAQERQDIPFEQLVEVLNPPRTPRHGPLFQIMLSMDTRENAQVSVGDVHFERVDADEPAARFELLLNAVEKSGGLHLHFDYNRKLFEPERIRLLGESMQQLLREAVRRPEEAIARLPLLTAGEKRWLHSLQPAPSPYPQDRLYQHIRRQAQRTPHAVAAVCGSQRLSYRQLDHRSNQIAHWLKGEGVGVNQLVGIALPASVEVLVGMLGIIKAGAAYVPIDPSYPAQRIVYMLQNSGVRHLLCRAGLAQQLGAELPSCLSCLCVDDEQQMASIDSQPEKELAVPDLPPHEHLLYAIYTSGSTGRPKAALVTHGGAMNLLHWYSAQFDAPMRSMVLSSLSFDLTQKNLWAPLMRGGTVVFNSQEHYDAAQICRLLKAERINSLNCTPSAFHPLVEDMARWPYLDSLTQVWLGGEPMTGHALNHWHAHSGCRLVNGYGPTECTAVVCWHEVQIGEKQPPIGRPIANTRLYILDESMQCCPPGAPGELCVGGVGVGPGYLDQPELTAQKFVDDPYSPPGAKLYRTGDLARYREDGNIDFLGRLDDQVKVRGLRIELGEIEHAITQQAEVRDVVVLAVGHGMQQTLMACIVLRDGQALAVPQLRQRLRLTLPEYMVPTHVQWLDALPLTPNGKVDRRRLAGLPLPLPQAEKGSYEAPEGEVEQLLADIFASILRLPLVGRREDFFELGGHSLLATQLVARINRAFGLELPVAAVFERPSVARLAQLLGEGLPSSANPVVPLRALETGVAPLSFAQQRLWFLQKLDPKSTAYNLFRALKLSGTLNMQALVQSFDRLVARHEVLRSRFPGAETGRIELLPALRLPVSHTDLSDCPLDDQASKVQRMMDVEAQTCFDLANDILIRLHLIRCGPYDHVLLINMHHIISDGWSIRIMLDEVQQGYADVLANRTSRPLPPLQYSDFAHWQQQKLTGSRLRQLQEYWRGCLGDALPALKLPGELMESELRTNAGDGLDLMLDLATLERLRSICQDQGASLFMLLVSALGTLLFRLSSQSDLVIGAPVAGRTEPESEALIGCFVNTLALRLDLAGNPGFTGLLRRVRKICLGAYEHQDMPFEKLIEYLQPERRLKRNPLFDVMLNLVNVPERTLAQGLSFKEMEAGPPQAKLGITIYAMEQADGLSLRFVWQRERYSRGHVEVLGHQLLGLLSQVASDPARPVDAYSLIVAHCQDLVPDPAAVLPHGPCTSVCELFREAVNRFGDHVAIRQRGQGFSYAELAQAVLVIARGLRDEEGLQPGQYVAVHGCRSFGLVATLIGVMLAGGVILPLDPRLHPGRRREIIDETGVDRLIEVQESSEQLTDLVNDTCWRHVRYVQAGERASQSFPDDFAPVDPDGPAYLFFTSGTTGRPKGIVGQHKSLAHFLVWQRDRFGIGPQDRAAQLTGLGFDVVLRDIFTALVSGATLCLLDDEQDLSASTLFAWLEREQVNYLHTVPTLAKSWLAGGTRPLPALQHVFFAGEPLSASLVKSWRKAVGEGSTLVNLYGPTETTLAKAFNVVVEGELAPTIPVGQPISASQLLVLSATHTRCGLGESGEIVVRTRFPSLGYLRGGHSQPHFMRNPFSTDEQDLIYFTGDLGYIRHDGLLCITGRRDDQVKIRGMRVELGEIHAAVTAMPQVAQAAITVFAGFNADKHIAAYYVPHRSGLSKLVVQQYVKSLLPDFMMPTAWIALERLPTLPNGKLDRRRLPDPLMALQDQVRPFQVAPNTELERKIAATWCRVLSREEVGLHDNFFELGGHSMLLLQVKSLLQQQLARDIDLVAFFRNPTISSLATHLSGKGAPSKQFDEVVERAKLRKQVSWRGRRRQSDDDVSDKD